MQRRDFLNIAAAGVTAASFNLPTIGKANTREIYKLRLTKGNVPGIYKGENKKRKQ